MAASSCFSSFCPFQTTRSHSLYPSPSSRGFLRLSSSSCPSLPPTIFASSARQSASSGSQYSLTVFPVINIKRLSKILAVVEEKPTVETSVPEESTPEAVEEALPRESRPFRLYVCNLPESTDVAELSELFKPYGSVLSVEVSRNAESGKSRGSGYVTMSSRDEAKDALSALDRTDLGGRDLCVRYAPPASPRTKEPPKQNFILESPHKLYVGNLAWSVRPEHLKEHFSQYGTVVSARILYDRKLGKNRVYGFLSFSSAEVLEAAKASDGVEFHGRTMLVRGTISKGET
ncbi:28 kDa ribonucleoprotein, chloroplastic-like [Nymphaea colorata]|nr:28 kDa ribonucleoprotein, chloroplastic-like [Nymphaea colorata]